MQPDALAGRIHHWKEFFDGKGRDASDDGDLKGVPAELFHSHTV